MQRAVSPAFHQTWWESLVQSGAQARMAQQIQAPSPRHTRTNTRSFPKRESCVYSSMKCIAKPRHVFSQCFGAEGSKVAEGIFAPNKTTTDLAPSLSLILSVVSCRTCAPTNQNHQSEGHTDIHPLFHSPFHEQKRSTCTLSIVHDCFHTH